MIEPSEAAQEAWFHTLLSKLGSQAMFFAECTPGYNNGEGVMDPIAIRMITAAGEAESRDPETDPVTGAACVCPSARVPIADGQR